MSHAMVPPTVSTPQPPETSTSETYLKIIKDVMGRFSPTGKTSDFLIHMADEPKKEEAQPSSVSLEIPPQMETQIEAPTTQSLSTQREAPDAPSSHAPSPIQEPHEEGENVPYIEEIDTEAAEGGDDEGNEVEEGDEEGQDNEMDENREELVERSSAEKEK